MGPDGLNAAREHQQDVKRVFAEVCDLDPERRRSRLDELCGKDLELRREVERLLKYDLADSLFAYESESEGSGDVPKEDEWIGRTIQSYEIH